MSFPSAAAETTIRKEPSPHALHNGIEPDSNTALDPAAAARQSPVNALEDRTPPAGPSEIDDVRLAGSVHRMGQVTFEVTDRQDAISRIQIAIRTRSCQIFAFCNMHTFNLARRSPVFAAALSKATVFNDGLGIDIASLILFGAPFPANLNGTDLTPALLASLDRPTSVFLLGSPPGVAEQAARALESRFKNVTIAGCHHGFFTLAEDEHIADRIRAARTDLVLVGMGNPRQELWAAEMAFRTGAVILCVGAFLDFTSGRISRAPRFVRAIRGEWLYRLLLEPVRLTERYIGGAAPFLWAVLTERFARRALKAQRRVNGLGEAR